MRASLALVIVVAAFTAGCGGSEKPSGSSQIPVVKNGEASKSPGRVVADAATAANSASSVHISGWYAKGGVRETLNFLLVPNGSKGSFAKNGFRFDVVRVGGKLYLRPGNKATLDHFAPNTKVAQLLRGKWLVGSAAGKGAPSFTLPTTMRSLFSSLLSYRRLVNGGTTTYQGQKVVEIRDASNSKLYVVASGKPYPFAMVGGGQDAEGTVRFDRWNQPVNITPPKNAINPKKLGQKS